ncbi:hypothetical protein H2248_003765 [Termitomyces sp. 'cryptogamus']|nr:hypothetical protein H2248_003765 [Termitomyces sp. 'cryptogamus']
MYCLAWIIHNFIMPSNTRPRKANKDTQKVWNEDKAMTDPHPYDIVIPWVILLLSSQRSNYLTESWASLGVGRARFGLGNLKISKLIRFQLINILSNNAAGLSVGHGVDPCTQTIQYIVVVHPTAPTHRIVLLDTPGLDSIDAPDDEILERIASWLKKSYSDGMKLAGVIFLYEISRARDLSLARKNLDRFESLCGDTATKNVLLVTTKWTTPPKDSDLDREAQLQGPGHWGQLIRRGSRMCRLDDLSYEAAWKLINLSLADAFTFDTEKIKDDVDRIRESLNKKGDSQGLITTLEELLLSQNNMALEMKRGGSTDILWSQLVENDRRVRDTLRQLNAKVPLSQKFISFLKSKFK